MKQKKNIHKTHMRPIIRIVLISIGVIGVCAYMLVHSFSGRVLGETVAVWPDRHQDPLYHLYRGKNRRPDLGTPQDLSIIQITATCPGITVYEGNVPKDLRYMELRLNQAILTKEIRDLPSKVLEGYSTFESSKLPDNMTQFLLIQGWARNTYSFQSPSKNKNESTSAFYPYWYMQRQFGSSIIKPVPYGEYVTPMLGVVPFWAIFPIQPSEQQFTIKFCPNTKWQDIKLDFTSNNVIHKQGNYSADFGLFLNQ